MPPSFSSRLTRAPMPRFTLFYTLIVPLVGAVLLLGSISMVYYLQNALQAEKVRAGVEDALALSGAVRQFRDFYASEIVPRAREGGMVITHDYQHTPGALPLPATFTLDFGLFMSLNTEGTQLKVLSNAPFPWRAQERILDEFEREALAAVALAPDEPYYRVSEKNGQSLLQLAVADRLKAACVHCHNTYPGSPKTDWKEGDVRGVLVVERPLFAETKVLEQGLFRVVLGACLLIGASMFLLWVIIQRLRQSMQENALKTWQAESAREQLEHEMRQRSEVESSMRLNEGKLRAIFDSILEGVVVIDERGRIAEVNRITCTMFGYGFRELVGQNVRILMPEPHKSQHDDYIQQFLNGAPPKIIGKLRQVEGLRRDGTRFPLQLAVSQVKVEQACYFAAVLTDITDHLASEATLKAARDEALDSARLKSEFLANMSHEIRTPMNGVIGMTYLLSQTELSEEQREWLKTIQKSSEALLTVINDILDFSKIEAGKLELLKSAFDPVQTVEETLELFSGAAAEKGLSLGYTLLSPIPEQVEGDEARLRQILNNLVGNAVKFTAHGHVVVRLETGAVPQQLHFTISDTGMGIPDDKRRFLFQPFSQVDGSITRQFGGTGLGLVICRQLVELMHGQIGVSSELGRGSTFWFNVFFDHSTTCSQRLALPESKPHHVIYWGNDPVFQAQMEGWGLTVSVARSPEAVAQALREQPPLAILMEYNGDEQALGEHINGVRQCLPETEKPPLGVLAHRHEALKLPPEAKQGCPFLYRPIRVQAMAGFLNAPAAAFSLTETSPAVPITRSGTPRDQEGSPAPDAGTAVALLEQKRVLVVEDNLVNQKLIVALLKRDGLACTVAANGQEGLEQLEKEPWDLVFMDCQMPVLDGFSASQRWREYENAHPHQRRTPIIALTANAMEGDKERCLEAGMDDYLSKPIRPDQLHATVQRWLGLSEQGT